MKKIRDSFEKILTLNETPERTALAFALGVLVGFSPFIGLHTILAVALSLLFRLNKVAILAGAWTNLPWIVVPYYALATWVGMGLLGYTSSISVPHVGFGDLLTSQFWSWLLAQWKLLVPAFAGSLVLAVLLGAAAYPITLYVLRRKRKETRKRPTTTD